MKNTAAPYPEIKKGEIQWGRWYNILLYYYLVYGPQIPAFVQRARDIKRVVDAYGPDVAQAARESWGSLAGADPRNIERVLKGVQEDNLRRATAPQDNPRSQVPRTGR
jgi:hypothetical protein